MEISWTDICGVVRQAQRVTGVPHGQTLDPSKDKMGEGQHRGRFLERATTSESVELITTIMPSLQTQNDSPRHRLLGSVGHLSPALLLLGCFDVPLNKRDNLRQVLLYLHPHRLPTHTHRVHLMNTSRLLDHTASYPCHLVQRSYSRLQALHDK